MQEKPSKACFRTTRRLDAADAVHSCFFSEGVFKGALINYQICSGRYASLDLPEIKSKSRQKEGSQGKGSATTRTDCRIVYSRYERGFQSIPVEHLIILADFYNVSTDYILGRTNKKEINK